METRTNRFNKYQCPCCEYFTLNKPPDNTFQDCPVCFWEDDGLQLHNPDLAEGANWVSLNQAKQNFKEFGAIEKRFKEYVRAPLKEEMDE